MPNPWEQEWDTGDNAPWMQNWSGVTAAPARPQPSDVLIDLSNPRGEGMPKQFAKGAAIALRRAGRGLKGLFGDLSPEDIAELDRMKAYEEQSGMPATLGDVAMQMPMYLGGPASMLGRAAQAGLVGGLTSPENRMEQAGYAAGGSLLGEALLGSTAKALRGPVAQAGVAEAYGEGLRPTIGQALGGMFKTAEEKATSIPLIGGSIQEAMKRSTESFNTATLQKIVDDLNRGVGTTGQTMTTLGGKTGVASKIVDIGEIQPGRAGFEQVKDAVRDAYGRLVQSSNGTMTDDMAAGLQGIRDMAQNLRPEFADQIDRIISNTIESRIKPGIRTSGETLKEIDSELTNLASQYKSSSIADERRIGDAVREAQRQLHMMLESENPGARQALQNADSAYWKIKRMEQATTSSVANEIATPAQLLQALRGKNRAQFAEGKMPLQDWAELNQQIIGNKYPDSGTPGRLALADVFAAGVAGIPQAAAGYAAGKALYSPSVQDFLVRQAIAQPGPMRSGLVSLADLARRPAAAGGAIIGQRTGR